MKILTIKTKQLVEATLITGVNCCEGEITSSYSAKKEMIVASIDRISELQIEIIKQTAIDFANWLEKLTPAQKISVWAKDGALQGLFTMDNEQLFDKFERQYTEPCNGNCGMNYCDENGCLENKPKVQGGVDLAVNSQPE